MRMRRQHDPDLPTVTTAYGTFDPAAFGRRGPLRALVGSTRGRLLLAGLVCALTAGVCTYAVLAARTVSVTQLVLVRPLAANSQVTAADVAAVQVPVAAVPDTSMLITGLQVSSGLTFTRVDLPAGTVLSTGPVGAFTRLTAQLLPGQLLASISVDARHAAGGAVKAGDVVDIYLSTPTPAGTSSSDDTGATATTGTAATDAAADLPAASTPTTAEPPATAPAATPAADGSSITAATPAPTPAPTRAAGSGRAVVPGPVEGVEVTGSGLTVFRRVKILDASIDVDSISQVRPSAAGQGPPAAPGVDSPALKDGIPSIYKIGVTRAQADVLAAAVVAGQGVMFMTVAAPDIPVPAPSPATGPPPASTPATPRPAVPTDPSPAPSPAPSAKPAATAASAAPVAGVS